jgi:hypothetical protein
MEVKLGNLRQHFGGLCSGEFEVMGYVTLLPRSTGI